MESLPTTRHLIDSAPEYLDHRIRIELYEHSLWEKFYHLWNEMIVTRQGRKMFPVLKLSISGLEQSGMYAVILQFNQLSSHRWKYLNGEWSSGGRAENMTQKNFYYHPDSPNYGFHWMRSQTAFHKLKLSNKESGSHQVKLNSLHKYEPVLKIFKIEPNSMHLVHKQELRLCQFIAVTAYQNEKVTSLKIQYNPYAKSFLEARERIMKNELAESSIEQKKENVQQNYYNVFLKGDNRAYAQQHIMNMQRNGGAMSCYGMNGLYPRIPLPYPSPSPSEHFVHEGNFQQFYNNGSMSGPTNDPQENYYHQNYFSSMQMQQQNAPKDTKKHQNLSYNYSNMQGYRGAMTNDSLNKNNNTQQNFPNCNNYISQQYQQNGNYKTAAYNHFTPSPFLDQQYYRLYNESVSPKDEHDQLDSTGGSPDQSLDISACSVESGSRNESTEWPTVYYNSDSNQQDLGNLLTVNRIPVH